MMSDDMTLVQEYARSNSEQAFATLVSRHINLVHSIALRQVGDAHLAEEITQAVFITLARKAKSLSPKTILSGWLCRTARKIAANTLRTERRRQFREQESQMQSILNESDSTAWNQIAPLLDEALNCLGEKEHDAVVLRFFDGKELEQVGAAMGTTEDAARMRVNRGLERLREFFTKRGVTFSAGAIAGTISANSVQAAPAGLAASISASALASGAAGATGTLAKLITITKLKTALMVAAMAAALTPALMQHQAVARLNRENARLTNELVVRAAPAPTRATNKVPTGPDAAARTQQEIARLNALAGKLTAEVAELEQMRAENGKLRTQLTMPPAGLLTPEETEALAKVKEEEESIACANNLKQLGLAVRVWAKGNGEINPPDVVSLSNELGSPKILLCPGDHARDPAKDWASYTSANCSYEYLAPSALHPDREPQAALFRCPIHGNVGLCDGTVGSRWAKKHPEWFVQRGGKVFLEMRAPQAGSAPVPQPGNPQSGTPPPGGSNK